MYRYEYTTGTAHERFHGHRSQQSAGRQAASRALNDPVDWKRFVMRKRGREKDFRFDDDGLTSTSTFHAQQPTPNTASHCLVS
jgi:hypothetical protein